MSRMVISAEASALCRAGSLSVEEAVDSYREGLRERGGQHRPLDAGRSGMDIAGCLASRRREVGFNLVALRGHDLACWCALGRTLPCGRAARAGERTARGGAVSDDSWKGEHLIRVRRPGESVDLRTMSHGGSMLSRKAGRCAFPDCGRPLTLRNRSGLCRAHNHAEGLCNCLQCARSGIRTSAALNRVCRAATYDGKTALNGTS